jgi:predicted nucleic acid-binding protein
VLTEAIVLLARQPTAQDAHVAALRELCRKYHDRPMSLADACVVRMTELFDRHQVFTLDSDFTVYRKHGSTPIPLIVPGA